MKPLTGLVLAVLLVSIFSTVASQAFASNQPVVGVKAGDWIKYQVNVSGGIPPPKLDINFFEIEILQVQDVTIHANVSTTFNNGTASSAIWKYNFAEGNTGGWTIIPANLSLAGSFYDSFKPGNVTVQGQENKTVAGAIRTITHSSDSKREIKEWDKATGVFTYAVEHPRNLTLTSTAVATNLWSVQADQTQDQAPLYRLIALVALAVLITAATAIVWRKKRLTFVSPRHQKIFALVTLAVLLLVISAVGTFPMTDTGLPLTFRDINVIMQTFWMSFLLLGMWFRSRGNYFLHEVLSIITVGATLGSFALVLFMSPPGTNDMAAYFSTPLNLWVVLAHSVVSFPALIFGVWLVALWRPNSPTYKAKSKRIAQLTMIFWILSYAVGIADFVVLRTTIFA